MNNNIIVTIIIFFIFYLLVREDNCSKLSFETSGLHF